VADKSNEITAIPRLLELLDLHGAFVTIDAMGCQKKVAQQITEGGGDYLLTVKENQGHLFEDIQACFVRAIESDFRGVRHDRYETEEYRHGRHEKRCYEVIYDPQGIRDAREWPKLCVVGYCYNERTEGGATSTEDRDFIGSRRAGARQYGRALRGHWRIENRQPDNCSSSLLCAAGLAPYHSRGGPTGVGRMVRPAPWPRRRLMPLDQPICAPPRP
jgi:predicted transposase YbfD/YdcC